MSFTLRSGLRSNRAEAVLRAGSDEQGALGDRVLFGAERIIGEDLAVELVMGGEPGGAERAGTVAKDAPLAERRRPGP